MKDAASIGVEAEDDKSHGAKGFLTGAVMTLVAAGLVVKLVAWGWLVKLAAGGWVVKLATGGWMVKLAAGGWVVKLAAVGFVVTPELAIAGLLFPVATVLLKGKPTAPTVASSFSLNGNDFRRIFSTPSPLKS